GSDLEKLTPLHAGAVPSAARRSGPALTDGWVALPDEVDDARATAVEPLACVLRGAERLPRGRVLVVGHGRASSRRSSSARVLPARRRPRGRTARRRSSRARRGADRPDGLRL